MKSKKIKSFLCIILGLFCLAGTTLDWLEKKSEHFVVYFTKDESFAQEVLDAAEKDYAHRL